MNEFEFIRKISDGIPRSCGDLIQGIGDDAAVIKGSEGKIYVVSADILAEGIHFKREWSSWKDIGRKSIIVNVSDIAAMGARPTFYFASVAVPKDMKEEDLDELYSGMSFEAEKYGLILAGGDTTASEKGLFISVTIMGEAIEEEVVYRRGARSGDKIYVTGRLGSALMLLRASSLSSPDSSLSSPDLIGGSINKRLDPPVKPGNDRKLPEDDTLPTPRPKIGRWLAKNKFATSMIDISDGLISDLGHIAEESKVGFRIESERVPAHESVSSVEDALISGEEYELVFTVAHERETEFINAFKGQNFGCEVTMIGEIIDDLNIQEVIDAKGHRIELSDKGFVHKIGKG